MEDIQAEAEEAVALLSKALAQIVTLANEDELFNLPGKKQTGELITAIYSGKPSLETTVSLIQILHHKQLYGEKPYWLHPVRVMNKLPKSAANDEKLAALLHDVVEDTLFTFEDLQLVGYSDAVIEMLKLLTKNPDKSKRPTYMNWIKSIIASGNIGAMRVKYADNEDNSDPENIATLPPEKRDIEKRYKKSMDILQAALNKASLNPY